VTINSVDPQKSIQFYSRVFGASPIKFRGVADALFVEKSFLLFNKVDQPADSKLNTGIWHIGWGGVDVKNEYEWWKRHNVDIHTPLSPLTGPDNYYMYINGPDKTEDAPAFQAHYLLGQILEKQGNKPGAAEEYRAALALAPAYEQAQSALKRVSQ